MLIQIDPIIFSIGPLQIRWYALMYVISFFVGGYLLKYLAKHGLSLLPKEKIDSSITYAIIGMFLGSRLTYVFVYNWDYYSQNLMDIIMIQKGGLSYHGAIFGMAMSLILFGRKNKIPPLHMLDIVCVAGAQGLFFGRLGNFINGELYGRISDVPWAMIFPGGGPYPRHPSQLYQSLLEGLALFLIMWWQKKRLVTGGQLTGIYLVGYGFFRFIVEFFREADSQLGYYFGNSITMGQILCCLMMIAGLMFIWYSKKKKTAIQL